MLHDVVGGRPVNGKGQVSLLFGLLHEEETMEAASKMSQVGKGKAENQATTCVVIHVSCD